jgi:hypothetical protein
MFFDKRLKASVQGALHESSSTQKISRKGAKAQSATAFLKGFLCAFAPLRENIFFLSKGPGCVLSTFRAKPVQGAKI